MIIHKCYSCVPEESSRFFCGKTLRFAQDGQHNEMSSIFLFTLTQVANYLKVHFFIIVFIYLFYKVIPAFGATQDVIAFVKYNYCIEVKIFTLS